MKVVELAKAKSALSACVAEARKTGRVLLTRNGSPVALIIGVVRPSLISA